MTFVNDPISFLRIIINSCKIGRQQKINTNIDMFRKRDETKNYESTDDNDRIISTTLK